MGQLYISKNKTKKNNKKPLQLNMKILNHLYKFNLYTIIDFRTISDLTAQYLCFFFFFKLIFFYHLNKKKKKKTKGFYHKKKAHMNNYTFPKIKQKKIIKKPLQLNMKHLEPFIQV